MRKSPCCAAKIRRFSGRRRQCTSCRKTWRIRPKKRGRPALRADIRLVRRVLHDRRSLTAIAHGRRLTRAALSRRFLKALQAHLARPKALMASSEDCILLLDGLWFRFRRRPWVLYLMALRPVRTDTATFIDPMLIEGPERKQAWLQAISSIPSDHRMKIRALVGDKFSGCLSIAQENGWVHQLCHFHLLAQLRGSLGGRSEVSAPLSRQEAYRLIQEALLTTDGKQLEVKIYLLKALLAEGKMSVHFKRAIRSFLRNVNEYHAYLAYPDLRLPRTNNSAEAMGHRIRDLMRQARNVSSPESLILWATKHIRLHPHVACKPTCLSTN